MKLTIEIPNERTAEVLRFLAALMPASQEIAADPLKVAMDDPVEAARDDPTRRELAWGDLIGPPPLPVGKTRWVNRGTFPGATAGFGTSCQSRVVYYLTHFGVWSTATEFSGRTTHIEAI